MPLRVFPVLGGARYSDDWNAGRSGGRTHKGNDLFSSEGTPVLAVDDGVVRFGTDVLGGNVANLRSTDSARYYYAHLTAFEGDSNRVVRAGDVIGYLGRTGNAATTAPHVHFEMHPGGGEAVDPYAYLQASDVVTSTTGVAARRIAGPLLIAAAVGLGAWAWAKSSSAPAWARRWAR